MKKAKLTLALVSSLTAVMALSACNEVTAKDGVVLTFTDNSGQRYEYKASELLDSYEQGSSAASTNFAKVKEVLIRKYYEEKGGSTLEQLKTKAQNSVDSIKKQAQTNANNNGTSYAAELETLLKSNSVKNVSELFESKLYSLEQDDFDRQFKNDSAVEAMKTGKNKDGSAYFPYSSEYGRGSNGYLIEKTPYHVSHFLVKFSSTSHSEASEFTITKAESQKISQAVKAFAGATGSDGTTEMSNRQSFGDICFTLPSDDTSATDYGDLGLMEEGYVSEFRLGVYAYDALYNQKHTASGSYASSTPDFTGNTDEVEIREHVLPSKTDTFGPKAKNTREYFESLGIGTIPYGAAVALGYEDVASDPNMAYKVNEGSATYYPRNILFNKYFNNRSVAVIVPEEVPFNQQYQEYKNGKNMTEAEAEAFVAQEKSSFDQNNGWYRGTYSSEYAQLPGFSVDTSDILDIKSTSGQSENVLTNERGQIILAVKASNSSGNAYEGIHFIVVNRSALDNYVKYDASAESGKSRYTIYENIEDAKAAGYSETNGQSTADITSLSDYFTVNIPSSSSFPTYNENKGKSTFVNRVVTSDKNYTEKANKISEAVKNYNSSEDTYEFQSLIEDQRLTFSTSDLGQQVEKLIKNYITFTREKNHEDEIKKLDDVWDTYAEALERQNEDRDIGDGRQRLISEAVALTYLGNDAKNGEGMYGYDSENKIGGIGYDGTK